MQSCSHRRAARKHEDLSHCRKPVYLHETLNHECCGWGCGQGPGNDWRRQICSVYHALLPRFQILWTSELHVVQEEKPSLRMVSAIQNLCASINCTLPPSTQMNRANKSMRRQKRHQIYPHCLIPLLIRDPDWPGENKQNMEELSVAHEWAQFLWI